MSRTTALRPPCDATASVLKADPAKLRPVTDLHCYICTPTPTFTNTSHLLTHLASKSHLRTLFEIELCATQCGDEGCTKALEKFHTWYYVENVGEHLVDRFIIKKGKWSREKLKSDVEESPQEGQENIMVNDAQVLRQQEELNENGLAEILIAAMDEDKKRKREDFTTSTRSTSRPSVDGILTPPCTAKGGTTRSAGGRKPLTSLINEASARVAQPPVEEQFVLPYANTPSSESSLNQAKTKEARFSAGLENEEETDINEGPDKGVAYSPRGPRLRGKVWPGMAVFDGAPSFNFMRTTPSRVFSPPGAPPSTTSVKEEKPSISGHINETSSGPSVPRAQDSKPGASLEPASCNSEPSAKRLKRTGTPLEQRVNGINAEVDNGSDLDVDADYEIEDDLEYILRENLAKAEGNQQLDLPTAVSNTTFPLPQVYGQTSVDAEKRCSQGLCKTSAAGVEVQARRIFPEPQFGHWQPINRAETNRTKHAMAIGSLINEGRVQDAMTDRIRSGSGIVHVVQQMNLDTLNQAYVSLYRPG